MIVNIELRQSMTRGLCLSVSTALYSCAFGFVSGETFLMGFEHTWEFRRSRQLRIYMCEFIMGFEHTWEIGRSRQLRIYMCWRI